MIVKIVDSQERASTEARKDGWAERGVALVLVLVLSAVGMIIMTTVLYVLMMGTSLSGAGKRFRTAHEAALGGMDVFRKIIQDQGATVIPGVAITYRPSFVNKLNAANLTAFDTLVSIDPGNVNTYELYVDLGNPVYRVYAKMTQKQRGDSATGYADVDTGGGVAKSLPTGGFHNLTYYTFTILAQKAVNPSERVRMDLVHIF